MAYYYIAILISFYLISCVPSSSHAQAATKFDLPFKAVNLGNWLVVEGWMEPSLFVGIPNRDLLDGTQLQLMSTKLNKYLSAENGGGSIVVANLSSDRQTFTLWRVNESYYNFRVFSKQFMGLVNQQVKAASNTAGYSETFQIVVRNSRIKIKASNGMFLQAKSETAVTADYQGSSWDDNDPSVFKINIVKRLCGEYQITNGYGPEKAPEIMKNHWDTYITEEDFKFMQDHAVTAVRIPVGWWLSKDPTPPKPFVGGVFAGLGQSFWMGRNGEDHSGTRDGYADWGESHIDETVAVIDFLAKRYANRPSLAAIELINEPANNHTKAPGVTTEALKKYYQAGYDAVRKHTSSAYVILSNRYNSNQTEFRPLATRLNRSVLDVHYYSLYAETYRKLSVQQNIDLVYKNRASEIKNLTKSNGPLIFVGEWTGKWEKPNTSEDDYKRFAQAQVEVYGRATFGWAFWSYKGPSKHWNFRWMVENNYIKL